MKPAIVAPRRFFDNLGSSIVNYVTHQMYNLGAGMDPNLVNKILDPYYLSKVSETFSNLSQTIQQNGPWASTWVGEFGRAYNSSGRHVSDTFVSNICYLDKLGVASRYNTEVYCRQTLVSGNYVGFLWNRLMGKGVLAVGSNVLPFLRSYAHCSKGRVNHTLFSFLFLTSQRAGITLLLINLNNQIDFIISAQNNMDMRLTMEENIFGENSFVIPLELTKDENILNFDLAGLNVSSRLYINPLSMSFIVISSDHELCEGLLLKSERVTERSISSKLH
ncbi:hypothetical protein SADUNF_Sadunf15G0046800 [Salix dunnii]|uniref:Uncharacterized protein n=1 Tax=Salix dunnii TaxID=1413687 RepID=A0A835JIA1_9ROSI|nr:hypothetical protein SADUNF_Sadunf15G0046800 [Salix dunnii]